MSSRHQGAGTARVLRRTWLSGGTFECELEKPPGFSFQPGQSIGVSFGGQERDYSLASGPEEHRLALCIRRVSGGSLSPLLAAADPGTTLTLSGPRGFFTYQGSERKAVFVATGTGVAPFVSMAKAGIRGFLLLHGVRTATELCYTEILRAAALRYVPCLSSAGGTPDAPGAYPGRVTDYLRQDLPPGQYDFYLCGRREMVRDVTLLADERFPGSLVFTEIFF